MSNRSYLHVPHVLSLFRENYPINTNGCQFSHKYINFANLVLNFLVKFQCRYSGQFSIEITDVAV